MTTLGGGKLGIYFPKDVLREMDIESKKKAILKPISRKKAILAQLSHRFLRLLNGD